MGGLLTVGRHFHEPITGSRVTKVFPIWILRGPLALSMMFLIVLLHPRMPSASNVEYARR